MKCKHCDEIISLDDAAQHSCFVGQEVFMDNENNLFAENITITLDKQPAVWDKNATLALLSLYEAKKDMLDHPKKKTKIWEAIAVGLQQDFGIQMSADQVSWKINALIKRYKQCVDNNSKSGRSLMTFEWFDQMDEIFGQQRNAAAEHTVTSKFSQLTKSTTSSAQKLYSKKSSTSTTSISNEAVLLENCSNKNVQISTSNNPTISKTNITKRPQHGSGSNIAKSKIALENQWLEYMKMKAERDKLIDEKQTATFEQKKETLKLKRKYIALKETEIEQRNEYFKAKLREKENRYAQQLAIEKDKCKLLKKLLKNETSDSE